MPLHDAEMAWFRSADMLADNEMAWRLGRAWVHRLPVCPACAALRERDAGEDAEPEDGR